MNRTAFGTLVLLLLAVWVIPLIIDADHTTSIASIRLDPTTRPSPYTNLRGQQGFWRIGQDAQGVWWFIRPTGEGEFLNTVTTVQPYQRGRDIDQPEYVSRDWSGGISDGGDVDKWAVATIKRVKDSGFKGLGAWSHPVFHKYDIPITRDLNIWLWMTPQSRRFYSPDWIINADRAVKGQAELLRDNKNLVGYFIDNELDWGDAFSGPGTYFDHLPIDDPNRAEVTSVIKTVWPTIESFNAEWNSNISDWKDLEKWDRLPHEPAPAYTKLFTNWVTHLATDYFRVTTTLVRKYDPNHLILGVRFKGYAPPEVVRGSAGYTDAQSLNYYVNDARLDLEQFKMMHELSGNQPVIISEYSFHSLDGSSGNKNTVGFAAQVLDQQARADGYRLFTSRLARVPYVIGCDWFQWMDEPPSGRSYDGEDVNFGVVDVHDKPYQLLVDAIRETTPLLNRFHDSSAQDPQADVWRDTFANKPEMNVPYLDAIPKIDGDLSDWSMASKLNGIRHSQTIGLERSQLPLPNAYLGWREDGIYLAMEVFDNDIEGVPADGWWWTRDNFEFWISTRPPSPNQRQYDPDCHQFFFVPNPSGVGAGNTKSFGTVGQWHRPGDALTDNLIPHPDIQSATRILKDRYIVEMFIPAKALHGFDPKTQPALGFNIHARNYQHATDYFWSAPKEMMTQLRPNTWGILELKGMPKVLPTAIAPTTKPAVQ